MYALCKQFRCFLFYIHMFLGLGPALKRAACFLKIQNRLCLVKLSGTVLKQSVFT